MNIATQPILVTGGAGFIGSNFVFDWLTSENTGVINLDKLTYAGSLSNLASAESDPRYTFVRGDICDLALVRRLFADHRPWAVVHMAAESHVDRSIHSADDFIRTNIEGTFHLLQAAREFWDGLHGTEKENFRFLHVSTDEVYGSLEAGEPAFTENSPYAPNSPYSASKAASDHLVRAYHQTYGLPVITSNCSNNYGPYQFPEKLIPLMTHNAISGKSLPVYGDGLQVRDWLYVSDHCAALRQVLHRGAVGQTYNVGGSGEMRNIDVVRAVCSLLAELRPGPDYESLITFVQDRPGHDRRYAIDSRKIRNEIGWTPQQSFSSGLRKTVEWYLDNQEWVCSVTSGAYRKWVQLQYHTAGGSIG
jgi:dTDP-glucose 4,6-dehydratase